MCELKIKTKGQALLPLLIIIVIVLSLGTAAIELAISNIVIARYYQEGTVGFYIVEAALENGLLRLLRNPEYLGEDLQVQGISCTIEISGQSPKIVGVCCNDGQKVRKIQAEASFVDGIMTVENIREME